MKAERVVSSVLALSVLLLLFVFLTLSVRVNDALEHEIEIMPMQINTQQSSVQLVPAVQQSEVVTEQFAVDGLLALAIELPVLSSLELTHSLQVHQPTLDAVLDETIDFKEVVSEIDINVVDVAALDAQPQLLTPVQIRLPKQIVLDLNGKNIPSILIKLNVLIDEGGLVHLMSVNENPYPALNNQIQALIKRSRFSSPTKQGKKVMSQFIWPIEVKV